MPFIITFQNFSSWPQSKIIPDATLNQAGVMTPAQVAKLAGLTPGNGAANAGVAVFSSSGSGEGVDFVTIGFLVPMASIDYAIELTPAVADASLSSPPQIFYDLVGKALGSMVIYPQSLFDGEVSWAVFNKTQ